MFQRKAEGSLYDTYVIDNVVDQYILMLSINIVLISIVVCASGLSYIRCIWACARLLLGILYVTYDVEYGQIPGSFWYRETVVTVRKQKYGLIPQERRLSDLGVQTP